MQYNDAGGPQYNAQDDEKLFVKFYMGTIKNEERTAQAGHPVFDDVPFIKVLVPGARDGIDTIADANYQRRFSTLWQQFKANLEQVHSGMPLKEWPAITRSVCEELLHMNVTTVEQLADLSDTYAQKIMGFYDLKRKAAIYLASAKDSAISQQLSEVNKAQAERITALEGEIARLSAAFEALTRGTDGPAGSANNPSRRK
jgi:hypothetical protein